MILDSIFGLENRAARVITGAGIDKDATLKRIFGTGPETTAGVRVDEDAAMAISAFYCGIRLLSWGPAQLPLQVFRRKENGDKVPQPGRPEYDVLHRAWNSELTAMKGREIGQVMRLLWGRSLNWIEKDGAGRLRGLWPLHTRDVRRERRPNGSVIYDISHCRDEDEFPRPPTSQTILQAQEVLDVPNFNGQSVVTNAREELGETIAAQQLGAGFYSGGSLYAFALKHPRRLSNDAKEDLRKHLQGVHGVKRRIPILDEGMELDKFGMPLKDAQFLDSRQWYITQIARWLDIPPHKLKDLTRATFSNIYEQREEWLESLLPHLKAWETEINLKMFPVGGPQRLFAEHAADAILRAHLEKRYQSYAKAIQWSQQSPNECRRKENLNSLGPAGDIILVPQNMNVVPLTDAARKLYKKLGIVREASTDHEQPEPVQQPAPIGQQRLPGNRLPQLTGNGKPQASLRAALRDRIGHMVRNETAEIRRAAATKHNFVGWVDRFYARFPARMNSAIEPVAEICRLDGLDVETDELVIQHCSDSRESLLTLTGEVTAGQLVDRVDSLMDEWEMRAPRRLTCLALKESTDAT